MEHRIGKHVIYVGDMRAILAGLESDSIDACVTDPPYGLTQRAGTTYKSAFPGRYDEAECRGGFMGMKWDGTAVEQSPETWAAVYLVLKPGAHLLAFGGTRTVHRIAVAIEDAGFEIRDQIAWLYGSGFPKSSDFAGYRDNNGVRQVKPEFVGTPFEEGWGTALKPAYEPIIVAASH